MQLLLTAEKIDKNYQVLKALIKKLDRGSELTRLYDDMELDDRIQMAPASSVEYFHNAIPGGYVDHVLRVYKFALATYDFWEAQGLDMSGFDKKELEFAALHHDLGKLGLPGENTELYQFNDSEWHRKNQGKVYKINPNIPHMTMLDRTLFIFNHYGIKYTLNELLGIRLADGMYDPENEKYFNVFEPANKLRNNIGYIMHHADMMASRFEYERWLKYSTKKFSSTAIPKPSTSTTSPTDEFSKLFS